MRPLEGILVVGLEHVIAAPFATRQLADLGARVIKVERPDEGDFARGYDERVRGLASHSCGAIEYTTRPRLSGSERQQVEITKRQSPNVDIFSKRIELIL